MKSWYTREILFSKRFDVFIPLHMYEIVHGLPNLRCALLISSCQYRGVEYFSGENVNRYVCWLMPLRKANCLPILAPQSVRKFDFSHFVSVFPLHLAYGLCLWLNTRTIRQSDSVCRSGRCSHLFVNAVRCDVRPLFSTRQSVTN